MNFKVLRFLTFGVLLPLTFLNLGEIDRATYQLGDKEEYDEILAKTYSENKLAFSRIKVDNVFVWIHIIKESTGKKLCKAIRKPNRRRGGKGLGVFA